MNNTIVFKFLKHKNPLLSLNGNAKIAGNRYNEQVQCYLGYTYEYSVSNRKCILAQNQNLNKCLFLPFGVDVVYDVRIEILITLFWHLCMIYSV